MTSPDSERPVWMIISWAHIDHADASYGRLLHRIQGTREYAESMARVAIHDNPELKPVGIVREIV